MKKFIAAFLIAITQYCLNITSTYAVVGPGDIVAPQFDNLGTVIVIHPSTGNREVISSASLGIGTGPVMSRPSSIDALPNGNFLISDTFHPSANSLFIVDRNNGNRTLLSGPTTGTGPQFDSPFTVLVQDPANAIVMSTGFGNFPTGFITKVNLTNGNRTLISGLGVGSGPDFDYPQGAAFRNNGHLVVGDYDLHSIFDVDLTTGGRTILSGGGVGTGPALGDVKDVVVMPDGNIIVSSVHSFNTTSLIKVDSLTGNRTQIINESYPSGYYEKIVLGPNGSLFASSPFDDSIYSVNVNNGVRTLVSGPGRGVGPGLFWGDMYVVPVPEPSTYVGVLLSVTFLGFLRVQKKKSQTV